MGHSVPLWAPHHQRLELLRSRWKLSSLVQGICKTNHPRPASSISFLLTNNDAQAAWRLWAYSTHCSYKQSPLSSDCVCMNMNTWGGKEERTRRSRGRKRVEGVCQRKWKHSLGQPWVTNCDPQTIHTHSGCTSGSCTMMLLLKICR